jgi:hypothetical protein
MTLAGNNRVILYAEIAPERLFLFAERPDNPRIAVTGLPAKGQKGRYLPG